MSQKKLGELTGYTANTVSDWETGKKEPDIITIKALVKIFDVTYDEILDDY